MKKCLTRFPQPAKIRTVRGIDSMVRICGRALEERGQDDECLINESSARSMLFEWANHGGYEMLDMEVADE
jgi:hypothetical protein